MNAHTKQRTNVSIDAALLTKARERGLKLSPLLEEAIQRKLSEDAAEAWLAENAAAIEAYNKDIEERGVFSDRLRRF
jgi:antitoxin CcdA